MANSKEKLEAFDKYNFSGDSGWIEYFNNITIPPGRSDGLAIVRRYKQKYYQKHVDPDFVVETLEEAAKATGRSSSYSSPSETASTTRSRPSAAPSSASGAGPAPSGPQSSSSSANASGPQQRPPGQDYETFNFLASAFVVVMAVVSVFPLTPASLSRRSFSMCLMCYFFLNAFAIYKKYGLPRTLSLDAARVWLQTISTGPEFLAIMHAGAFMPVGRPIILAVVPVACHLAVPAAEYLQQRVARAQIYRTYFEKPCTWLTTNRTLVKLFAANMEISLGFLLIVFLFTPQRSILTLFFYWQILKLQFHSPATAWYHGQVWTGLGAQVEPFLGRYAPFLLTYLGYAKQWFQRVPGAQ